MIINVTKYTKPELQIKINTLLDDLSHQRALVYHYEKQIKRMNKVMDV